jgi:CO/xanthine dehydrogenase FAD-binding subunit
MPGFELIDAESIEETIFFLNKHIGKVGVLAGGTDLLPLMKDRVNGPQLRIPEVLINIKTIPGMDKITFDEKSGLRIGSTVTLNCLETSNLIKQKFSILAQAAREVGTTQIRNMGTVGGNLCQRPRCMYFRHPHFVCRKKGGESCFAMTHFRETVLKPDEFLSGIKVPLPKTKTYQVFLKSRIRRSSDFALSSVAIVARMSDGVCDTIQIVLGGVAPFPYIASQAMEMLKGKKITEKLISQAADASVEKAHPFHDNRYKVDLTKALTIRALKAVTSSSH